MRIAESVQMREDEYFVGSSRITPRSVVEDWKRGRTPEHIATSFPSLPLVTIYGAITT